MAAFSQKKFLTFGDAKDQSGFTIKYREDPIFLDPRNKNLGARLIINLEKLYLSLKKLDLHDANLKEYYSLSHSLGIVPKDLNKLKDKLFGIECNFEELNGIDFKKGCYVGQGEIFCVMGLSGSGKSTLVRHINRLLEPTSGKILINGQDVMQLDREHLQELRNKKIGMVFQNFALMPHRSVVDNIAMPLEIRGVSKNDRLDAANKILEIVELQGWGNKFAHELSGGIQQRVGLARALAADPEFLLMDEPFSALDPLIRRQLQSEFIKLSKQMKKTTVFITHDLDEEIGRASCRERV